MYRLRVIVPSGRGLYICLSSESNGPNLLDEPLKGFIVNSADVPWKWVKRLATSGERVNHDSQRKCTTSAECKTSVISDPVWNMAHVQVNEIL